MGWLLFVVVKNCVLIRYLVRYLHSPNTLGSSGLEQRFEIDVLEVERSSSRQNLAIADKELAAGDILIVGGTKDNFLKIRDERGIEILPDIKFRYESLNGYSSREQAMAEALIVSKSSFVGTTLKDLRFRQRYNAIVLAIRRGEEIIRDRLREVQ